MEHLKKELLKELHEVGEDVKAKKGLSEEDVSMIYHLAKTYYYLRKLEEEESHMSSPMSEQPQKGIY